MAMACELASNIDCMQSLLDDLAVEVENGSLDSVSFSVDRILNRPNNVRRNLYSAIESINAGTRQPAREAVGAFLFPFADTSTE